MNTYSAYYSSEIGLLEVTGTEQVITGIHFRDAYPHDPVKKVPACVEACIVQLDEYFRGKRRVFDLPLAPDGTEFQKKVWQQLLSIPYGKSVSYLNMAENLGDVKTIRAAASANGKNPIAIIIPCHRVIGKDGSLTGYAGGLWRKEWLLKHEHIIVPSKQMQLFA